MGADVEVMFGGKVRCVCPMKCDRLQHGMATSRVRSGQAIAFALETQA
jgi:hypothetical protein